MNAGRVEDLMVHLTPSETRMTHDAGIKYARASAGVPTSTFLQALAQQASLIARCGIGAGFGTRQARTAAREFEAAARAEWRRIMDTDGGSAERA